jgi:hypothetical protein
MAIALRDCLYSEMQMNDAVLFPSITSIPPSSVSCCGLFVVVEVLNSNNGSGSQKIELMN